MTSQCPLPIESLVPPRAPILPPPLSTNLLNVSFSLPLCGIQAPIPPPPPLPPPPTAMGAVTPHVYGLEKSQLLKEALEKSCPVAKGREDVKRLLKLHKDRFRSDLQWILFCADLPSLIQEGPQCGLVALWMAGTLLSPPSGISLERLVQVAMERGYTAQGEMFSVADMGRLAQETLGCQAELIYGGLGGPNRTRVLQHLITGQPMLIPYDEDFNHEPCLRKGHKAHWAVCAGILVGVQGTLSLSYLEDPEMPGLFHPAPGAASHLPSLPEEGTPGTVFLLSKQGKSWHYQLWDYDQVRDSNLQLTDFSPARATDGRVYVVPTGGVRAGLCGQALLLRSRESSH
ncbi:PREDICTED: UPF0692 protein C19orf54 homolog [Dipodomys ordii]|uniref:Actin maturation protease n=1 Tax=Dipodomys ordii TaxID=10020 RepID=A0A1S3GGV4_DIPOR|nr:PREDICTED: UPF0692 protein C19orf54 homolog [Dipodomys ordii]XP_012888099.1 PREDICTED: UPF0692 protein C19orf54 homolog [Dipodomys ordii]